MNPIKNNIINALNIENLSKEEQEDIILQVGSVIYQNVLMRTMETMPENIVDEFEKQLDNNTEPEQIFDFLKNNVKDFEKIIEEESIKFKDKASMIMGEI
ncbi:MAG: DUF5663 domain-containing protein [Candidatus Paceibacterota bacterium]